MVYGQITVEVIPQLPEARRFKYSCSNALTLIKSNSQRYNNASFLLYSFPLLYRHVRLGRTRTLFQPLPFVTNVVLNSCSYLQADPASDLKLVSGWWWVLVR